MKSRSLALALSLVLSAAIPAVADDVITLNLSRAPLFGAPSPVQQSYILVTAGTSRSVCYVLSPGGSGRLFVADTFPFLSVNQTNFLVRSRHLFAGAAQLGTGGDEAEQGSCVAVLDAAEDFLFFSPRGRGLRGFRRSAERIGDIAAVIEDLQVRFGADLRVVLVGTSRGTIDMTEAAIQLDVDALVNTSTLTRGSSGSPDNVFNSELSEVRVPTALFFHDDDGCFVTPPEDVKVLEEELVNAPRVEVRGFNGGFPPVDPNPCRATTFHGFLGKEREVVRDIVKFVNKVIEEAEDDD